MADKKVKTPKEDVVAPLEDGVVEVIEKVEKKGLCGVELDRDIPWGPKKGVRYFDNEDDAKAYHARFGGKLV